MSETTDPADRLTFLSRLLEKTLDGWDAGDAKLRRLAPDVESVVESIADVDTDSARVEALRSAWARLELTNALALDSGREQLTDDERRDVDAAVGELRSLAQSVPTGSGR